MEEKHTLKYSGSYCPYAKKEAYGYDMCFLNSHQCVLANRMECPTYEDWIFEERQKEIDQVGKEGEYGYGRG